MIVLSIVTVKGIIFRRSLWCCLILKTVKNSTTLRVNLMKLLIKINGIPCNLSIYHRHPLIVQKRMKQHRRTEEQINFVKIH